MRSLSHGAPAHELQLMDPDFRQDGTTYYSVESGAAVAIAYHPKRTVHTMGSLVSTGLQMGAVGLGTGTIAVYGQDGDQIRFYEIDQTVVSLAGEYFYFQKDSLAEIRTILGGAVPTHLLTREAFALYWNHLNSDGALAVHVTSRYLDLTPVVRMLASELGKQAIWISSDENPHSGVSVPDWVLVTDNRLFLNPLGDVESSNSLADTC